MRKNTLKGKIKILSYFAAFIFMVVIHMAIDKKTANKENDEYGEMSSNNINNQDSLYDEEGGTRKFISLMKIKSFQLIQMEKYK